MTDAPDLPEMRTGVLDEDDLRALLRDLRECATVHHIALRQAGRRMADEAATTLEEAGALLLAGNAAGIQIRYNHDGREYCDTVLRTPDGFRLVRL